MRLMKIVKELIEIRISETIVFDKKLKISDVEP